MRRFGRNYAGGMGGFGKQKSINVPMFNSLPIAAHMIPEWGDVSQDVLCASSESDLGYFNDGDVIIRVVKTVHFARYLL